MKELENELQQLEYTNFNSPSSPRSPSSPSTTQPHDQVSAIRKERQSKEIKLLRKTIEEMELRIETQKQTLDARDSSIRKLLEMLQSKGLASKQYEEDKLEIDRWREKAIVEERKVMKLEVLLDQKDQELSAVTEVTIFGKFFLLSVRIYSLRIIDLHILKINCNIVKYYTVHC